MSDPGAIPAVDEMGLRMAGESLVVEFFARVDRVDLDGAVALYADQAVFLGARGPVEIRATMERGLAAHAGMRTRHVIGNLRSHVVGGMVLVEYTNIAYTLDGSGGPRSVLDQEMLLRREPGAGLRILEHRIMGYELP